MIVIISAFACRACLDLEERAAAVVAALSMTLCLPVGQFLACRSGTMANDAFLALGMKREMYGSPTLSSRKLTASFFA